MSGKESKMALLMYKYPVITTKMSKNRVKMKNSHCYNAISAGSHHLTKQEIHVKHKKLDENLEN